MMELTWGNFLSLGILGCAIWGLGDILNRVKNTIFAEHAKDGGKE